jgi:nitrite reductase/ring-hydroxylating ferredoxin subunit
MAHGYVPVLWNRQKRRYDRVMAGLILLYLAVFFILHGLLHPDITAETLLIRATGTLAFLMLHVVLAIGPLARLNPGLLPLLYNRRHLGVTLFMIGLAHGVLNIIQFHALGNTSPLLSVFTSNTHYGSLQRFPFEPLGFAALVILFLMAATSHDFWLKNLGPGVWKSLHMMVYAAYGLLLMHVMLGVVQLEKGPAGIAAAGLGMVLLISLHLLAGFRERNTARRLTAPPDGYVEVCGWEEIPENRAKTVLIQGENIAIFRYEGLISAVSNRCRHQNGPLGEGKIVDGCITCPWHGYQYLPRSGQSPPPFTERVETYDVKLLGSRVYVHPRPYPEGTERPPARIPQLLNPHENA